MRDFRSVPVSVYQRQLRVTSIVQPRVLSLTKAVMIISVLLLTSACGQDQLTERQTDTESLFNQKKQYEIAEIEESIKNSYARLAAQHNDVCPKLLQKDIGDNDIKRTAEVMVDDYCDYFIYLHTGQHLAVNLNNSQIEALLIVPTIHNFADGEYQVTSYDKHVIRLAYKGATYKPERLNYDVTITVTN